MLPTCCQRALKEKKKLTLTPFRRQKLLLALLSSSVFYGQVQTTRFSKKKKKRKKKSALAERKQRRPPPPPPSSSIWLGSSSSIPFLRKVCGVVAQQSQDFSYFNCAAASNVTGYSGVIKHWMQICLVRGLLREAVWRVPPVQESHDMRKIKSEVGSDNAACLNTVCFTV